MHKKVIIIGGGPAGLMAAYQLKKNHIEFILLEKNSILGKKFLISGHSRCNITNHLDNQQFMKQLTLKHKKFLYSTLSNFNTLDIVDFFTKKNVPLYLDGDLKYFPISNKSKDLVDVFSSFIDQDVSYQNEVLSIEKEGSFKIKTTRGNYTSDYVIVATGSKSYPKTGSTGDGSVFAKSLGINTIPFYPSETSVYSKFVAQNKEFLQGISIPNAIIKLTGTKIKTKGDLLFTHFGLSGPSIFHISDQIYFALKEEKNMLSISLVDKTENEVRDMIENNSDKHILKFLESLTFKRVARFIMNYRNIVNKRIKELSKKEINYIIKDLTNLEIKIDKTETVEKAFVNGGGISTKELNPKTFMSRDIPNLYFIGESVDLHGPIGGFNMTIALSSGYTASNSIINNEVNNNEF